MQRARSGKASAQRHRVLMVGSSGGHLAQMLALRSWWAERERAWVTFDLADAVSQLRDERVYFAHHPTTRSVPNLLRNFGVAVRVLLLERPDLVVSTGAGVALPFFMLARAAGVPTVYVEVYDRVASRTLSGRLCRPFTTVFLVQWQGQQDLYPGSVVMGRLL